VPEQFDLSISPPFHEARTQPELARLIREGRIPNLPQGYSKDLDAVVKTMLRQNVSCLLLLYVPGVYTLSARDVAQIAADN
jgi:hypothetical protein